MGEDFSDDSVLIAALRQGDELAFAWLLDTYDAPLHRTALGFVSSSAIADDVVQDTWLGVIRGIDRFEGRSSLKTWIFQILMNIARTRGVRESRTVPFSSAEPRGDAADLGFSADHFRSATDEWPGHWARPPRPWQPAEVFDQRDLLGRVHAAIGELPPTQRIVMSLRDIDGWSSDEVCDVLDLTQTNQRVLLHRARASVRAALNPYRETVDA